MKKIFSLLLVCTIIISLCACGGVSLKDIEGTWTMELPYKQDGMGVPAFQMELHKGGTGKGYEKKNDKVDKSRYYYLNWEIKDDLIVVSYAADPMSWSFEMDAEKTKIVEVTSGNSFIKE